MTDEKKPEMTVADLKQMANLYHVPMTDQTLKGIAGDSLSLNTSGGNLALNGTGDLTNTGDIAAAGTEAGLALAGYATQAQFLINCGITDVMARVPADEAGRYLPLSNAANRLLSPAEMGELFKVLAVTAPALGCPAGLDLAQPDRVSP